MRMAKTRRKTAVVFVALLHHHRHRHRHEKYHVATTCSHHPRLALVSSSSSWPSSSLFVELVAFGRKNKSRRRMFVSVEGSGKSKKNSSKRILVISRESKEVHGMAWRCFEDEWNGWLVWRLCWIIFFEQRKRIAGFVSRFSKWIVDVIISKTWLEAVDVQGCTSRILVIKGESKKIHGVVGRWNKCK